MSDLIAIVYPSEERAHHVLGAMERLERAHLVDLSDACVVTKAGDGKVAFTRR